MQRDHSLHMNSVSSIQNLSFLFSNNISAGYAMHIFIASRLFALNSLVQCNETILLSNIKDKHHNHTLIPTNNHNSTGNCNLHSPEDGSIVHNFCSALNKEYCQAPLLFLSLFSPKRIQTNTDFNEVKTVLITFDASTSCPFSRPHWILHTIYVGSLTPHPRICFTQQTEPLNHLQIPNDHFSNSRLLFVDFLRVNARWFLSVDENNLGFLPRFPSFESFQLLLL